MAGSEYAAEVITADGSKIVENGLLQFLDASNQPATNQNPVTSGTLVSLSSWVSGTAKQNPNTYPTNVVLACTSDASNNAATVLIALSPDNTTYTTLGTWSVAAALNNLGAVTDIIPVVVPTAWYIKLTIGAHAAVAASVTY
jgi:hypothetical protein